MKNAIPMALLLLGLLSSCTIEDRLERREDRLQGTWYFERAFYKADGALFRDNVINEFDGDAITFFNDYTALYDDYSLEATFDGDWSLFADRSFYDDENEDVEFFLDMSFYDFVNQEDFTYYGNVTRLTRNRLNMRVNLRNGFYTFKLRR